MTKNNGIECRMDNYYATLTLRNSAMTSLKLKLLFLHREVKNTSLSERKMLWTCNGRREIDLRWQPDRLTFCHSRIEARNCNEGCRRSVIKCSDPGQMSHCVTHAPPGCETPITSSVGQQVHVSVLIDWDKLHYFDETTCPAPINKYNLNIEN